MILFAVIAVLEMKTNKKVCGRYRWHQSKDSYT